MIAAAAVALTTAASGCSTSLQTAGADRSVPTLRSPWCGAASLSVTVAGRDGAALPSPPTDEGAVLLALVLTNEGDRSCVLQGWPTVRLASHGDPFGPPALEIRAVPAPAVTLRSGKEAQVYLALHSGSAPVRCRPVEPDALSVVVPHTVRALTAGLPTGYLGSTCRSETAPLIGVQAVLPR